MSLTPSFQFSYNINGLDITHDIYVEGQGKTILLLQELPGIDENTIALVNKLVSNGFRVVLPHLFGKFGKKQTIINAFKILCIRKEIDAFSSNINSPIVGWLKALSQHICTQFGLNGIGVIGMCITGNFAISLIVDKHIKASVASQPSLPIFKPKNIGYSENEISEIKNAIDEKGEILAFRFSQDFLCKKEKFQMYDSTFNITEKTRIKLTELNSEKKIHSVLTKELFEGQNVLSEKAFDEVSNYFKIRLS
jgi:dienelactone hydrolase